MLQHLHGNLGSSHTPHLRLVRSVLSPIIKKEIIIALKEGVSAGENLQALILSLYVPKPIVVMA